MKQSGFTLIEIIIALVIVSTLATVASTSLFTLLRGASKTEILKEVKQNGDYALSVMDVKVRNARQILPTYPCDGTPQPGVEIQNPDLSTTRFSCAVDGSLQRLQEQDSSPVQSNYLTSSQVTIPRQSSTCEAANVAFRCSTSAVDGKSKTVTIIYNLMQGATNVPITEQATQKFTVQISVRNK